VIIYLQCLFPGCRSCSQHDFN